MFQNKIDSNSGVQAHVGFDFQRNTCIYLFLEQYHILKTKKYFIFLEHYDDIVFCVLNSEDKLSEVSTYQAKKSSTTWTTNSVYEIVHKIVNSGIEIEKDPYPKASNYNKSQHFITNNTIALDYKCTNTKKTKKVKVNETNETVSFLSLDSDCKKTLKKGNKYINFSSEQITHFDNLTFNFIDLGRNTKSQLELLTGKFKSVFGDSILDHIAARDTLIFHLKKIESKYNQGDLPKFNDKLKRFESGAVENILQILTTQKLALDFCRSKAERICEELNINVFDAKTFELDFENSLDEFKDLKQGEHQKIIRYIESKKSFIATFNNDVLCIKELYNLYLNEMNSTLSSLQLKASIAAGYFLIVMQK